MRELLNLVESLGASTGDANGKFPVKHLGLISCANSVHIRHVPFYDPCVILVLSGRKVIFNGQDPMPCEAGSALTVPAPGSFDLRNEPANDRFKYRALVIPFTHRDVELLHKSHFSHYLCRQDQISILQFARDDTLIAAVKHYLSSPQDTRLVAHRLTEILLLLASHDPRLLSYCLSQQNWAPRVRAILAADLTRDWGLLDVCQSLATTESTLRRQLQRENTGFRELLYDLRLGSALLQLLQTTVPVYQVAYGCGYQSVSRFTNNFRKRFGLTPTALRASVGEYEQRLPEKGQFVSR